MNTCPMPQCQTTAGCQCGQSRNVYDAIEEVGFYDGFRAGQQDILRRLRESDAVLRCARKEAVSTFARMESALRVAADAIEREIKGE